MASAQDNSDLPVCPTADTYFDQYIAGKASYISGRQSDYLALYWKEKGAAAMLEQYNGRVFLLRVYDGKKIPRDRRKIGKPLRAYHKALEKGKTDIAKPTNVADEPIEAYLNYALKSLKCQFDPQGRSADVERREEEAYEKLSPQAKRGVLYSRIDKMAASGQDDQARAIMRENWPIYMRKFEAAEKTMAMPCAPAAGASASKAELLEQFTIFHANDDEKLSSAWFNVRAYGRGSAAYQKMRDLEAAYALQLVSRFGLELLADEKDVLYVLGNCSKYVNENCHTIRTFNTTYARLKEYYGRVNSGDTTPLDISTLPMSNRSTFPSDDAEIWKASVLGQCSMEHVNRTVTAAPEIKIAGWDNPVRNAQDCSRVYAQMGPKFSQGKVRLSDQSVRWLLKYEQLKGQSCDAWPDELTPPSMNVPPPQTATESYTLEQGLQDISRAASCMRTEEQCVTKDGYRTCRLVTVNVC